MTTYPDAYLALKAQLSVDLMDIDNELMKMPQLVQDAAELAAEASDDENVSHLAYDVMKAEAGMRLREEATDRITEAAIERQLPLDEGVQEARMAYENAVTYAKLCTALVNALRTKSSLLQKASDLIIAGYITPSAAYERRREAINSQRNR